MSDIWIKQTTGTSSTTWKKAVSLFVKTTTGTTSAAWKAATAVYVYFSSGWTRVWPLSGVFKITSPYITTSSGSTTPLYGVDGARRVGSVVWGKNGTWNANGWVINSYQYRWRAYNSSDINDTNIGSQTALATYSSAVSLTIPATYDRKYLSFFIQANSSGGAAYNGFAESGTEYGGLQIVRQQPINISASLNNLAPQVGNTINFSSSWNTTDAYAPEAGRTTIQWYKNLNNSTTGGTFLSSGSYSYIVQSSDLNHYIYAVETTFNSGTDYDLGINTGVSVSRITTSVVTAGLTPPTSVSIASVSRNDDSSVLVSLNFSGGSGPYYQMYWVNSASSPTTDLYDAASTGSPITDTFSPSNNYTAYFYVRSSSENLGNTLNGGTGTAGTYSNYSSLSPNPSYTFLQPSGSVSVSPSSGTAGTTQFTATPSVSASPSAQILYQWQYFEGGAFGWLAIGGATSSTYTPPSNYVSLYGSNLRCQITANNGVGTQLVTTAAATVSAALTKLATPTGVNATDTRTDGVNVTWNAVSGAAYYGVWYGPPAPGYDSLADFGGNRNTSLITGTSYLDTSLANGVTRDYYVQAYRSGDPTGTKSDWGGPDSGTRANVVANLTAPSIFNVVKSGSNYLVYFSGGSGPAYQVWWQTSAGTPTTTGFDASGSSSPITVTNLTASAGSTYYFSARSVSSAGNIGSGPSSTISSWSGQYAYTEPSATPATAPGTPGTPTNGWTSGTSYPFSWTAPSAGTVTGGGAATINNYSMRIYEATSSSGTGATLITTFNTGSGSSSYTYTSPNASLYYAASVAAINSAGLQGSYSGISQYK